MLDKIDSIITEYQGLMSELAKPETINDKNKLKELSIKQGELSELYDKASSYKKLQQDINDANELLKNENDHDSIEFYRDIVSDNEELLKNIGKELSLLLNDNDPNNGRNAIIELRAGTGGEEAALFAADLFRMYSRYAEKRNWQIEQMDSHYSDNGGFKEIVFMVNGRNAYGTLKFENGVHRVQRVPATEAAGRIHTSAASVVVLAEAEDVDIKINDQDLRIDVYRSTGPGGQSVNTTDSAVRITYLPTGLVVTCQDGKSQLKNKEKALAVLKSRLYDIELQKQQQQQREKRLQAIQGGDRSMKIKTYNYPQDRLTDHRIKHTWHNLQQILNGELDEVLRTTKELLTTLK